MNLGKDLNYVDEHKAGEGDEVKACHRLRQSLVITGEAVEPGRPREGALDHPPPRQQHEAPTRRHPLFLHQGRLSAHGHANEYDGASNYDHPRQFIGVQNQPILDHQYHSTTAFIVKFRHFRLPELVRGAEPRLFQTATRPDANKNKRPQGGHDLQTPHPAKVGREITQPLLDLARRGSALCNGCRMTVIAKQAREARFLPGQSPTRSRHLSPGRLPAPDNRC